MLPHPQPLKLHSLVRGGITNQQSPALWSQVVWDARPAQFPQRSQVDLGMRQEHAQTQGASLCCATGWRVRVYVCVCMCVYACVRACLYVCLCVSTHARSLLMQRVVMAAQLGTLPLPLQPVLPIPL